MKNAEMLYGPLDGGTADHSWRGLIAPACKLVYYCVMFLAGILCIVVYIRLSPVFSRVNGLVDKADVLFKVVYDAACLKEPILHAAQCAILQKQT